MTGPIFIIPPWAQTVGPRYLVLAHECWTWLFLKPQCQQTDPHRFLESRTECGEKVFWEHTTGSRSQLLAGGITAIQAIFHPLLEQAEKNKTELRKKQTDKGLFHLFSAQGRLVGSTESYFYVVWTCRLDNWLASRNQRKPGVFAMCGQTKTKESRVFELYSPHMHPRDYLHRGLIGYLLPKLFTYLPRVFLKFLAWDTLDKKKYEL